MFEFDHTKEYGLPIEENLRPMRISGNPIQLEEGLSCNDQLESKGIIQIMEYVGGGAYLPTASNGTGRNVNAVMVAEIAVFVNINVEKREVHIRRIHHEYGHDDLVPILMGQVINFARFYNCRIVVADQKKIRGMQSLLSRAKACI